MKKLEFIVSLVVLAVFLVSCSAGMVSLPKNSRLVGIINSKEVYELGEEAVLTADFNLRGDYQDKITYDWTIVNEFGETANFTKEGNGKKVIVDNKSGKYTAYFEVKDSEKTVRSMEKVFYIPQKENITMKINVESPEVTPDFNWVFMGYAVNDTVDIPHEQLITERLSKNLWTITFNLKAGDKIRMVPTMGNWISNRARYLAGGTLLTDKIAYKDEEITIKVPTWYQKQKLDKEMFRNPLLAFDNEDMTSLKVTWQDNKELKPIYLGKKGEEPLEVESYFTTVGKEAILRNLEKNTIYYYSIEKDGAKYYFRTPDGTNKVKLAIFSDAQNFPKEIAQGAKLLKSYNPEFVVACGDLMDNGNFSKEWNKTFFEPVFPTLSNMPFYSAPGNHNEISSLFNKYLGTKKSWKVINYNNLKIIFMDSYATFAKGSEQYNFIEKELKEDSQWKIIITHESPYSNVPRHYSNFDMREYLAPLFEKYGVDLVVSGHNHTYARSEKINGVKYVVMPCMGAYVADPEDKAGKDGYNEKLIYGKNGFGIVNIDDNKLSFDVIDIDNNLMDTFTLEK